MTVLAAALAEGLVSQRGLPGVMRLPHYHDHIELNLLEGGAMTYFMAGQSFTVKSGLLLAFWAAVPHQVIDIAPDTTLHWLYIPLSDLLSWTLPPGFLEVLLSGQPIISQIQPQDPAMFQQWHEDLSRQEEELNAIVLLEVEARLRRLGYSHRQSESRLTAPGPGSSVNLQQARQMAAYIAQHYTEALTVDEIAAVVNLHPNYAMHVFKSQLQTSILDYLTRHRLAHAQRLLLTSPLPIGEVSLEAGFGSASRFYAVFKQYCGQSPGQYRRRLQYPG